MRRARIAVLIMGVFLPYMARIPGIFVHGVDWLTQYFGGEGVMHAIGAFLFFGMFEAICWGSILAATLTYRHARAVWFPAVCGFVLPIYAHLSLDLAADAQEAVALIFIPIYSLPFVFVGWLLGWLYDRKTTRESADSDNVK